MEKEKERESKKKIGKRSGTSSIVKDVVART